MTDDAPSPAPRPSGDAAGLLRRAPSTRSTRGATRTPMPSGVLEVLRLLVVVFFFQV